MASSASNRTQVATYLGIVLGTSAIFWWLIISGGSLAGHGGLYVLGLMWCPGVAGLTTRLAYQGNLKGHGWGWGGTRWQLLAYALPIAYAAAVYGIVWLTGTGALDLSRFGTPWLRFIFVGSALSCTSALGEELGWRGFLVPKLAEMTTFTRTALLSGAIWTLWHVPLILFADYNGGTPGWYSVACFAVMVVGISFAFAWLRLRSGSVWTGMLMHASHNLWIQGFFDRVTVDTGPTKWLIGEFGAGLALAAVVVALVFWRLRDRLPGRAAAAPRAEAEPQPA